MIEVSCRVRRGDFLLELDTRLAHRATGIFGRSGAGKTSLLHALAGLIPVDALRLVIDGEAVVDTRTGLDSPPHRRRLGMVFQDHRLFPHLSIDANLRFGMAQQGPGPGIDEVVELLDIGNLLKRRPDQCSGGEGQRVAMGRALLSAPRMLLLDEPLASLDRGLKRQILPYLRRIRDHYDLPILMISHDLAELLALTDELLLLDRGAIAGQGPLPQLATDSDTLELLHDCGLVFALPGRVARRDPDGLAWIRPDGASERELACGDCPAEPGDRVEMVLRPEDLVLARPPVETPLSLTNRLPGRVVSVTRSSARCLVTLDCGLSAPVLAEVTERAVRDLSLTPSQPVVALCKAQAMQVRRIGTSTESSTDRRNR
ncbi:molybdenum ABC transporter ATP-binding protein [Myxococcota bacterium]|nr:molybdenum ABC transporter ATP-binding protein [Myxococcota bacterium]